MLKSLILKLVLLLIVFGVAAPMIVHGDLFKDNPNVAFAQTATTTKKDPLGSFDVSKYLKIDDGQTYLETTTTDANNKGKPNLNSGVVYFMIKIIELLTKIIGSFALLFLIAGGLTLMISHGNAQLQTKGKQMILYALLGVIVAFGSLIIVTFVQSLFFTA